MSEKQFDTHSELPPLRLHHFLTWTALTAVLLTLVFTFIAKSDEMAAWFVIAWLPSFLGGTLGLAIFGFGLRWRYQGLPFPSQPDHGITILWTVTFGIAFLWSLVIAAARAATGDYGGLGYPQWVLRLAEWESHASTFISIALCLWLAWWIQPARRWQVFFALYAAANGHTYLDRLYQATLYRAINHLELVGPLLANAIHHVLFDLPSLVPAIALLLAVIWDRRDGVQRHWSHWAGIVAWCSILPNEIAAALVNTGWLPYPVPIETAL
jgi:hypothetical protein